MLSSTLLKWAVPSAAAILLATTVPAIAAHVSHKPLAVTHKTAHSLVTTTPAGAAKTHVLHSTASKAKTLHATANAKTLTSHKPVAHKLTAKAHKPTTLSQKKTSGLDKPASVVSNM